MMIRPYSEADWARVRTIYDLSKPDEMRASVDAAMILPLENDPAMLALFRESTILVAEVSGAIVGFGGSRGGYISWLFVHPEHRRKGVARSLLANILARIDGPATLNVLRENTAARRLYERFGFTVVREAEGEFNGHQVHVLTLHREPGFEHDN